MRSDRSPNQRGWLDPAVTEPGRPPETTGPTIWSRPFHCLTQGLSGSTLSSMDYRDVITIEAGKRSGKPCVRGLRITVSDVLDYLASGMTDDEILQDFPDLTRNDIRACLAFAADRERRLLVPGAA